MKKKREDSSKLTRDEMRRLLAHVVRLNPAECLCPPKQENSSEGGVNDSDTLDLDRVREIAGPAIQQMVVHESTRTFKNGNSTTNRKITLRFVDKIRAMRFDEKLLEREEADQAKEVVSEAKQKEYEAAQRRAKALIKWKLLGGPDTPYPTFDKDGYEVEEEQEKPNADTSANHPPPTTKTPPSPARPPPPSPPMRTEGRERLVV